MNHVETVEEIYLRMQNVLNVSNVLAWFVMIVPDALRNNFIQFVCLTRLTKPILCQQLSLVTT